MPLVPSSSPQQAVLPWARRAGVLLARQGTEAQVQGWAGAEVGAMNSLGDYACMSLWAGEGKGGRGVVCRESHFGMCPGEPAAVSLVSGEGFCLTAPSLVQGVPCAPLCRRVPGVRAGSPAHSRSHPPVFLAPRPRHFLGDHCSQLCFPAGPKVLSHSAVSMETALLAGIGFGGRGCR